MTEVSISTATPTVVIVPVHNGGEVVLKCLKSIHASKLSSEHEVLVIDDASTNARFAWQLASLAQELGFTFARNDKNLGFAGTCNSGFAMRPECDVIILNSDTLVFGDWISRLQRVAYAEPSIGTVTPLTNNGTIASYPRFNGSNNEDLEMSWAEIDRIAAEVNEGTWVSAPTGIGFCLYIKRHGLELVGGFDQEAFPRGYGEETDFCLRLSQSGLKSVIAPGVFVYHAEGSSFGAERGSLLDRAQLIIDRRYPEYSKRVGEFLVEDPLLKYRRHIDVARISRHTQGRGLLLVSHNWGGGTEKHLQAVLARCEREDVPVVVARPDPTDKRAMHLEVPLASDTLNLPRISALRAPGDFGALMKSIGVAQVHIHNLVGYDQVFVSLLRDALASEAIPLEVTIHDFQSICPRINLVGLTGVYCGEPDIEGCQTCVDTLGSPWGKVPVWLWRREYGDLLRSAQRVWAPSFDAAERVERHYPGLCVEVREHDDVEISAERMSTTGWSQPQVPRRPSDIVLLGALEAHKGSRVLEEVAREAIRANVNVTFEVIGYTDRDRALAALGNVRIHGAYDDSHLLALIRAAEPRAVWFPAVWPETYSYTLSYALKADVPVIAFDLGAMRSRLLGDERATLLPLDLMLDPARLLSSILRAIDERIPQQLMR